MKNKILGILLSVVVAFGLWMYVITVVSPESEKTYYEIPVVLQNKNILTERGLMVVSDDPSVTLALKSDRTILNDLNESNINVIVNVANVEKPGTYNLTYTISYPGNIPPTSVSVQSSSTDMITLKVENRARKTVPVVVDYGDSAVPEGYMIDPKNTQIDVASIEISGPESAINQIEQAVIRVDLNNQTKTLVGEYQYALCDRQGEPVNAEKVTVNAEKVNLTVTILRVKELAIKVNVLYGGGANEQTAKVTWDTTRIQVAGSDTLLENMDTLTVGTVNLAEILEDQTLTFAIAESLPEGITNLTGVDEVKVDVKFSGLTMKSFNATAITAVNVPEGMRVDVITKALTVTVRGSASVIKNLHSSDLRVEVDLSKTQAGTFNVMANVVIDDTFPGVGAVGTYPVSVQMWEN